MQTQEIAQPPPDAINKFLIEQLQGALNFLSQSQSIGSTHFIYPASVINSTAKSIETALQTIQTLNAPKPQMPPTENKPESKIIPSVENKK